MFAVVITLVVFVSTALLIYQYWTGSLMPADSETAASPATPESIERSPARDATPALDTAA